MNKKKQMVFNQFKFNLKKQKHNKDKRLNIISKFTKKLKNK